MSEFFRKPIVKTLMLKGQEGQSIKGITKTDTSGLVDTYTITLTDGTMSTFTVTNGKEISGIEKTGTDVLVDTYTIEFNDGTNSTFTVTNGNGISNIRKTGTSGLVDTYTITFNNGTTSKFTVTNGAKGDSIPSGGTAGQFLKKKSDSDYDYVWETLYPVDSIYISANSTSPASLFGGMWEQLKDRFLLAAGDTYEAGSTGGEAEHALTVAELAKHKHQQRFGNRSGHNQNAIRYIEFSENIYGETWVDNTSAMESGFTGEGKAHNNMPPYLSVYMWKRIA